MQPTLRRYAVISILAAIATIVLKGGAFLLTGSVGLLSDALESVVNLLAAIFALYALSLAARPPDEEHAYGHGKVEYFSSGFEGALILIAAASIAWTAVGRFLHPTPIVDAGLGIGISLVASVINFAAARVLAQAGRRYDSITLEADAKHLMTDVWTSVGVVAGVGAAAATGWARLDPLIAILVAANVIRSGVDLLRRSTLGLLDTGLPGPLRSRIVEILDNHRAGGVEYHAIRTRQSGARRFVSFHILVPGDWTVQRGHDLLEEIEEEIRAIIPNSTIFTHLEPLEDPVSFEDTHLERRRSGDQEH
jgi:cation diffusion facilitator family transporter